MIYDFLFHQDKDRDEVVKEGWSWPAFFFTWLWAIFKGLWVYSIVTFFLFFFLGFVFGMNESGALSLLLLSFLAMFVYGGNGNKWWKDSLLNQGFKVVTTISANTGQEAVRIYIDRLKTQKKQPFTQASDTEHQKDGSMSDNLKVLEKLAELKGKGVLTEAEFIAQKNKLLGNK